MEFKGIVLLEGENPKIFSYQYITRENPMDIFLPHTRKIIFNKTHSETPKLFEFEFKLLKTLNSFI